MTSLARLIALVCSVLFATSSAWAAKPAKAGAAKAGAAKSGAAKAGATKSGAAKGGAKAAAKGPPCTSLKIPAGFRSFAPGEKAGFKFLDKAPGLGGTRCSRVVVAKAGTVVYRRYDGKTAARFGGFWSERRYTPVAGRKAMSVCKDWNDMHLEVSCSFKKDTKVGLGFSQSVFQDPKVPGSGCKDPKEVYDANGSLQVFLPGSPADRQAALDCPPKKPAAPGVKAGKTGAAKTGAAKTGAAKTGAAKGGAAKAGMGGKTSPSPAAP